MSINSTVLSQTFGEHGTAVAFFGSWWLVGLFLILLFVVFLNAYRVNANGILIFVTFGLLSTSYYSLFVIGEQITQTVLFILFIYVGYMTYLFFNR